VKLPARRDDNQLRDIGVNRHLGTRAFRHLLVPANELSTSG
jgi:hypothetical protein